MKQTIFIYDVCCLCRNRLICFILCGIFISERPMIFNGNIKRNLLHVRSSEKKAKQKSTSVYFLRQHLESRKKNCMNQISCRKAICIENKDLEDALLFCISWGKKKIDPQLLLVPRCMLAFKIIFSNLLKLRSKLALPLKLL